MSNLNSLFDILGGRAPHDSSAMEGNFIQASGESPILSEGMIVKVTAATHLPYATKLTSGNVSNIVQDDYPWIVIEGMDQSDAALANRVTCLLLKTGVVAKIPTGGSFAIGDLVYANAGVTTKVNAAQQAFGQVIEVNTTGGYIVVAC